MNTAKYLTELAVDIREATTTRDNCIVTMREEGASYGEIAKAAGMSRSGVVRVLERAQPGSDDPS